MAAPSRNAGLINFSDSDDDFYGEILPDEVVDDDDGNDDGNDSASAGDKTAAQVGDKRSRGDSDEFEANTGSNSTNHDVPADVVGGDGQELRAAKRARRGSDGGAPKVRKGAWGGAAKKKAGPAAVTFDTQSAVVPLAGHARGRVNSFSSRGGTGAAAAAGLNLSAAPFQPQPPQQQQQQQQPDRRDRDHDRRDRDRDRRDHDMDMDMPERDPRRGGSYAAPGGGGGMGRGGGMGGSDGLGGEWLDGEVTNARPGKDYCFIDRDVFAHKTACKLGQHGGWPVQPGVKVRYRRVENRNNPKNKWKADEFTVTARGMGGAGARSMGGTGGGEWLDGEVTNARPGNDYCFIEGDVFAHKTQCRPGPLGGWPVQPGDKVRYERVENHKNPKNKWKADAFTVTVRGNGFSERAKELRAARGAGKGGASSRRLVEAPAEDLSASDMVLVRYVPRAVFNLGRINAFFEQFGEVVNVRMKRGIHENIAYVQFLSQQGAHRAAKSKIPVLGVPAITVQMARGAKTPADTPATPSAVVGGGVGPHDATPGATGTGGSTPGGGGRKALLALARDGGAATAAAPPPEEEFKVTDTAKLLAERRKIKDKKDALQKLLREKKEALMRKQVVAYRSMLSKLSGGKDDRF